MIRTHRHKRSWLHLIDWSQPIYNDRDLDNAIKDARNRVRYNGTIALTLTDRDAVRLRRFHRIINQRMILSGHEFMPNRLVGPLQAINLP